MEITSVIMVLYVKKLVIKCPYMPLEVCESLSSNSTSHLLISRNFLVMVKPVALKDFTQPSTTKMQHFSWLGTYCRYSYTNRIDIYGTTGISSMAFMVN